MAMLTKAQREATQKAVSRIVADRIERHGLDQILATGWEIQQAEGCPTRLRVEVKPIYISRWELAEITRALETNE